MADNWNNTSFEEEVAQGAIIVSVPVISMMLGSAMAVVYEPSVLLRCLCSSTAAGILVAAVAFELLPIITDHDTSWYSGAGGFAFGIAFFMFLSHVLPDPDDDEEDEEDEGEDSTDERSPLLGTAREAGDSDPAVRKIDCVSKTEADFFQEKFRNDPLFLGRDGNQIKLAVPFDGRATPSINERPPRYDFDVCGGPGCSERGADQMVDDIEDFIGDNLSVSLSKSKTCVGSACKCGPNLTITNSAYSGEKTSVTHDGITVAKTAALMSELGIATKSPFSPTDSSSSKTGASLPWTRLAVVGIDGFIDGLTLGIALNVGVKEAALIAVAMTLEMCFVGVSLSCALKKYNKPRAVNLAIVIATPLTMGVGFVVGAYALYGVEETSDHFVAVIGFAAAALLYLAFSELIPECIELADEVKNPMVSMSTWLTVTQFGGFILILLLEKLTDDEDPEIV